MKANSKTQSDMNLDFDGMAGNGVNRGANRFAKNQWSGHSNDGRLVNFPRGPVKGNTDNTATTGKRPPASSMPAVKQGKDTFPASANPQVRTPGGTRAWAPSAGQNYTGNPDKINVGRGPMKGNE